jgi:TRL (tRNA-associated locus)-like protein
MARMFSVKSPGIYDQPSNAIQKYKGGSTMKKQALVTAIVLSTLSLSGCATGVKAPIVGGLYTNTKGPEFATANTAASKTGKATCEAVLGIATGDCSIETAMKEAGIHKIHYVDSKVKSVLGIYVEYTTIVHGE